MKSKKIHRALEFEQSPWLKKYIDLNSQLRQLATTEFGKYFYKLMNNSAFGKTMEDVTKRKEVHLVTSWKGRYGAESWISKPNSHACTIFNENLVDIEMDKLEVIMDKPIYIGMSVLDISKTVLYEFHYELAKSKMGTNCKLLYTDTDSLLYEIKCPDIYEIVKENIKRFDTSDYPPQNPYKIPLVNKKVPGLMKDECNGRIVTEFIGLRSKMYCVGIENNKFVRKANGVKSNVMQNTINDSHYRDCLLNSTLIHREQFNITSRFHQLYTENFNKLALNPYDDKRCLLPNCTDTLPWGHKNANLPKL